MQLGIRPGSGFPSGIDRLRQATYDPLYRCNALSFDQGPDAEVSIDGMAGRAEEFEDLPALIDLVGSRISPKVLCRVLRSLAERCPFCDSQYPNLRRGLTKMHRCVME